MPPAPLAVNDYKAIDPVLPGVAYTSECFHCKPGTYSAQPGSAHCAPCPADSYSTKGATVCHQCEQDKYSGIHVCLSLSTETHRAHWCDLKRLIVFVDMAAPTTATYLHVTTHTKACKYYIYCFRGYRVCFSYHWILKWAVCFPSSWLLLLVFPFPQTLDQGAADWDLHVQTATTSTLTLPVTQRERWCILNAPHEFSRTQGEISLPASCSSTQPSVETIGFP